MLLQYTYMNVQKTILKLKWGGGEGLESGDDIFAEQNPPNGGFNILLHHSP